MRQYEVEIPPRFGAIVAWCWSGMRAGVREGQGGAGECRPGGFGRPRRGCCGTSAPMPSPWWTASGSRTTSYTLPSAAATAMCTGAVLPPAFCRAPPPLPLSPALFSRARARDGFDLSTQTVNECLLRYY